MNLIKNVNVVFLVIPLLKIKLVVKKLKFKIVS